MKSGKLLGIIEGLTMIMKMFGGAHQMSASLSGVVMTVRTFKLLELLTLQVHLSCRRWGTAVRHYHIFQNYTLGNNKKHHCQILLNNFAKCVCLDRTLWINGKSKMSSILNTTFWDLKTDFMRDSCGWDTADDAKSKIVRFLKIINWGKLKNKQPQ